MQFNTRWMKVIFISLFKCPDWLYLQDNIYRFIILFLKKQRENVFLKKKNKSIIPISFETQKINEKHENFANNAFWNIWMLSEGQNDSWCCKLWESEKDAIDRHVHIGSRVFLRSISRAQQLDTWEHTLYWSPF